MAKRTIRSDDLDGTEGEGVSAVTFSLDGVTYDIDLTEENVDKLREAFEPFIKVATARTKKQKPGERPKRSPKELAEIRTWGHANGYEFSDKGRINKHVIEAWEKFSGSTS
jgi:hypothetical protein